MKTGWRVAGSGWRRGTDLSSRAERAVLCVPALALLAIVALHDARVTPAQAAPVAAHVAAAPATRYPLPATPLLRVCADPNNLPFSNRKEEGFENRIAHLLARDLGAKVEYMWWAQRRGFVRNTLAAGGCDVLLGVPAGFERALTTQPYYTSSYVFVTPAAKHYALTGFDDPRLRALRIGVQMVGDDYANTPPAHALARRGIVDNVTGYTLYGDYREANPPARIVDAVARGEIDVAVVWGPLGGYFAKRARRKLDVVPVSPRVDPPHLPLTFAIALGVAKGREGLRDSLQLVLDRRSAEIRRILDEFGVPQLDAPTPRAAAP
jgi:quinoprotein dehydrogenase-associated probable ABC transporter substrate-binding protein